MNIKDLRKILESNDKVNIAFSDEQSAKFAINKLKRTFELNVRPPADKYYDQTEEVNRYTICIKLLDSVLDDYGFMIVSDEDLRANRWTRFNELLLNGDDLTL